MVQSPKNAMHCQNDYIESILADSSHTTKTLEMGTLNYYYFDAKGYDSTMYLFTGTNVDMRLWRAESGTTLQTLETNQYSLVIKTTNKLDQFSSFRGQFGHTSLDQYFRVELIALDEVNDYFVQRISLKDNCEYVNTGG